MDVSQSPQEISYIEMMPTDVMIPIFNKLDLVDVMKCENISQQTQEAAANFYRTKFEKLGLNSDNLSCYARSNDQDCNLSFARAMFRAIGPYVKALQIDYRTFRCDLVRPLSEIIREHCENLTKAYITGAFDHKITMVNMRNVEQMYIKHCLFDNQDILEPSRKLSTLVIISISMTDFDKLISPYPCIKDLTLIITLKSMEALRSLASLTCLTDFTLIIYPGSTEDERQIQKSIDFSMLFKDLQSLPNLVRVHLRLPLFMRISHEIVETSVKSLRHKCEVRLAVQFNQYLEPEQIRSLRDDLDGLDGIYAAIKLVQTDMLMSLSSFVRLRLLHLTLCGQQEQEEFDNHQIVGVLAALVEGARKQNCYLEDVNFYARPATTRVGVEHLPSISEFLQVAKELKRLRIYHCTSELVKLKTLMQKKNVDLLFSIKSTVCPKRPRL